MTDEERSMMDAAMRNRARKVCSLIGDSPCTDPVEPDPQRKPCEPKTCYVWELIEMGRVGHPE